MLPADVEEALLARAIKAFTKASNHLSMMSYLFQIMKGGSTEQASVRKVTVIPSHLVYSCLSVSEFTFYNNQPP